MDTNLTHLLPHLKYYEGMDGSLYELLCAKILIDAGWQVEWLGQQKGAYIDLLATRGNVVCALECKRHETKIGIGAVRQVHASRCLNSDITHTVVVASSGFTAAAELMAQESSTVLLEHVELTELFERIQTQRFGSLTASSEANAITQSTTRYTRIPWAIRDIHRLRRALEAVYTSYKTNAFAFDASTDLISTCARDVSLRYMPQRLMILVETPFRSLHNTFSFPIHEGTPTADPVASLIAALRAAPSFPRIADLNHIPRVLAGIFATAHRDRELGLELDLASNGSFWDTSTGKRLCQIVGFKPNSRKHLTRITNVRDLLGYLTLHRPTTPLGTSEVNDGSVSPNPIIKTQALRLHSNIRHIDGLNRKHDWRAFGVDRSLFEATLDTQDRGAPAFMLLDERAFGLESASAFNLYWALVDNLYSYSHSTQTQPHRSHPTKFVTSLGTLCDRASILPKGSRVLRTRTMLADAFEQMVQLGLIDSWECDALAMLGAGMRRKTMFEAKLWVTLSHPTLND